MAIDVKDIYNNSIKLTEEQTACVEYDDDDNLVIKGFAGSGKSTVLTAILCKCIDAYKDSIGKKVIFITFQNTLVSATRELVEENGCNADSIRVATVNKYVNEVYSDLQAKGFANKYRYFSNDSKGREKREEIISQVLKNDRQKNGKHKLNSEDKVRFWSDEIDWIKAKNIWKGDLKKYQVVSRKGRGSELKLGTSELSKAFEIYEGYCEYLESKKLGDWIDQCLYLNRNPQLISDEYKYETILIDEAQDLSLAQMSLLKKLASKRMSIAMDMNQKIHDSSWTIRELGIAGVTKMLSQPMRTTREIDDLAECIRYKNDLIFKDEDRSERAKPNKEGGKPQLYCCKDQAHENRLLIKLVEQIKQADPNSTIGIIAARTKWKNDQLTQYSALMADGCIDHEILKKDSTFSAKKPGVKIVSAYSAKGLEFDYVIIPRFIEGCFPYSYKPSDKEEDRLFQVKMRNIVYVSMTRAKKKLFISWSEKNASRYIKEFDTDLYELHEV